MTDPTDLSRAFAQAFGAQDADAMAALFAETGTFHSLTGQWAEGQRAIRDGQAAEFAGLSRMARLVSGKVALTPLGETGCIVHQRFVVTGLRDADGGEIARVAAMLTAVLAKDGSAWQVVTATFAPIEG